jgi:hypothetical protein
VIGYDWQEAQKIELPKIVVIRAGILKLARQGLDECGVMEPPAGRAGGGKQLRDAG